MSRVRLTPKRIDDFTCPPGKQQAFLRDSEQPGLGLRATAGSKTFIFQGKLAGEVVRMSIGDPKTWTVEEARKEARRLKAIIDAGRDPRQEKAERIAAEQKAYRQTVQARQLALVAWDEYVQTRAPHWTARYTEDHRRAVSPGGTPITRGRRPGMGSKTQPGILHELLSQPLNEIRRDKVIRWLDANAAIRAEATKRALAMLQAFIAWCADRPAYQDQVHANACTGLTRALPRGKARTDCLEREQLANWFSAVRSLSNFVISAYLQALLLTGARRNELASLRWEDVDFKWNRLTLRDKVEGERTIPLTPYVAQLFRELKRINDTPPPEWRILHGKRIQNDLQNWKPSPWVFASRTAASGFIQEPRNAHSRALKIGGLPAISLHGLRRSFGTLAEWVEAPAGVIAQIQGHKPSAIAEKHYRRRPLDLLRQWHTKIETWILTEAGIYPPATQTEAPKNQATPLHLTAAA
ncbi:MAG: integrase family protein [Pigmentiphaga sp.]|uniref:tyrosine-type recombinase/integrase n=2 Tax=Pigmentiphaga TaxID=152267 RepID=UPI0029AF9211|nr:integrase family protein [Pigmentiphaga sp.]MDX3907382.1 integrase family protein [Pigmentiphaga sp.]